MGPFPLLSQPKRMYPFNHNEMNIPMMERHVNYNGPYNFRHSYYQPDMYQAHGMPDTQAQMYNNHDFEGGQQHQGQAGQGYDGINPYLPGFEGPPYSHSNQGYENIPLAYGQTNQGYEAMPHPHPYGQVPPGYDSVPHPYGPANNFNNGPPSYGQYSMPPQPNNAMSGGGFSPFANPLQSKKTPQQSSGQYPNPYPKQAFMQKNQPSSFKSIMNQFKTQEGTVDVTKMMNTAGQMMGTVNQVQSMFKGLGGIFKAT